MTPAFPTYASGPETVPVGLGIYRVKVKNLRLEGTIRYNALLNWLGLIP